MAKIDVMKPPGLNALKQFGQDILTAVEKYEQNVKKELAGKDGK